MTMACKTGACLLAMWTWVLLGFSLPLDAAEWRRSGDPECTVEAVGGIEAGDKAALEKLLQAGSRQVLCLNSPGGSYSEAIEVIELISRTLQQPIATRVKAGTECLSACALIFLAGNNGTSAKGQREPLRHLDARGLLGFHGPYIRTGSIASDPKLAAEAFRAGLRAIGRLLERGEETMFPSDLLVGALQKGADEFLYVDTVGKAGEWSINIVGYRKPTSFTTQMLQRACLNDTIWRVGIDSDSVSKTPGPVIQLKNSRFRGVYPGFGDEGTFRCTVDVYRDAKGEHYLDLYLDDVPHAGALEQAAKRATSPGKAPGKPLWYVFRPETKLSEIAQ
jgi:hypothetical protein